MYKLNLEKEDEPETKLPAFTGSQTKQDNSRKTSGTASWTKLKSWTVWKQLWNIIKGMRISDYLTCHLGNLCAGQEVKIRTLYGITNCFKIGKGV